MDTQEITKTLESLRKKSEDIKQQRSKLEGEEHALQSRILEIEKRAIDEADADINKLPEMIKSYEDKISGYIKQIKETLGE